MKLCVWGTVRSIPISCCVVEVVGPGLLVIKHRAGEHPRKFVNLAVLEGAETKVIDQHASATNGSSALVNSLLRSHSPSPFDDVDLPMELAVAMRAHGRGGALLVIPADGDEWRESVAHPIPYTVTPRCSGLREFARADDAQPGRRWGRELGEVVEMIAGLTAVDGATVITDTRHLSAVQFVQDQRNAEALVASQDGRFTVFS